VPDSYVAPQVQHVALLEDIAHESKRLAGVKCAAFLGADAGRVLAPMLQYRQRVIDRLIHRPVRNDPDDSTHGDWSS
jgi:hypothetical protein